MTADDVVRRLDAAGIANGRLNDVARRSPRTSNSRRATGGARSTTESGADRRVASAGDSSTESNRSMGGVPAVGEHTDAVLAELGYDRATIDACARRELYDDRDHQLHATRALAEFAAELRYDDIPSAVIDGAKDLMVDWLGSALAGKGARPSSRSSSSPRAMGPATDASEIIPTERATSRAVRGAHQRRRRRTSPSRTTCTTARCFIRRRSSSRPSLAVAQAEGASGRDLLVAGRSPATKSAFASANSSADRITRSFIRPVPPARSRRRRPSRASCGSTPTRTQHALGSAGTQAAGLWEFLRDAADSKQLHTAKAAADGLLSAYLARAGVTGARRILEGAQGLAAGHVDRRRSVAAHRRARHALGDD